MGIIYSVDSNGGTSNAIQNVNGAAAGYTDIPYSLSDNDTVILYDPGSNKFVVFAGEDTSHAAADIATVQATHSGATQVGPTEFGVEDNAGFSSQRLTDGDTTWVDATPAPGAVNCFAPGTMIATPGGECPVETLAPGDLVLTADGSTTAVRFNLQQRVTLRGVYAERMTPVCISAGALGDGLPHSDLIVTADHGMILEGLVINASAMVNGNSIRFVPSADLPPRLTCYHIETAQHDVLIANGAASESYVDAGSRKGFDNFTAYIALYGAESALPDMPLPRISSLRLLPDSIKLKLGMNTVRKTLARIA